MSRRSALLLACALALPSISRAAGPMCLLPSEGGGGCADSKGVIAAGLKALAASPTGRELLAQLKLGGTQLVLQAGSYAQYSDTEDLIKADPEFFAKAKDWQTAVILAHELEHARQRALGLSKPEDRGFRELGAFFVQCRVWVELGAKTRGLDWAENAWNAQDHWAWLNFPASAAAALSLRGTLHPFAEEGSPAWSYWQGVLEAERAWRGEWLWAYPKDHDSLAAAHFVLKQAAQAAQLSAAVSERLPEVLEFLFRAAPGQSAALEARPTLEDVSVLAALPFDARPSESGGAWRAVRR